MKEDEELKILCEILKKINQMCTVLERLDPNTPTGPVRDISQSIQRIR